MPRRSEGGGIPVMRRPKAPAWTFWAAGGAIQLGLLAATLPQIVPGLGVPTWHHNASLAAAMLLTLVFWRRMASDRRFLGIGVLVTTALALASAFLLLYLKDDLKSAGLKDWAKWWHVAWSWFALVFFVGHTWANRYGMLRSLRALQTRRAPAIAFVAANALIVVLVPLTWAPWSDATIHDGNYIGITLYTWLLFLVPSYGAWLVATWRLRLGRPLAWARRPRIQAFTDSWLLSMTLWANLTGLPILYLGTKDTSLKFIAKYGHTWPSIALAILVFAHTIQFLPAVGRRLRRQDPA